VNLLNEKKNNELNDLKREISKLESKFTDLSLRKNYNIDFDGKFLY